MRLKYTVHREEWAVIFHVTASAGERRLFGGWAVPRAIYRYRRQKAAQIIRAERAEFMRQARAKLAASPVDFQTLLHTGTIRPTQQSPGVPGKKASGATLVP